MKRFSLKTLFVLDFAALILTAGPGLFALSCAAAVFSAWSSNVWFAVPLALLTYAAGFLSVLCLLRLVLPRQKAGVFAVGFNKGFVAWQLHTALARAPHIWGLHKPLQATYLLRFFYWRALGAQVSLKTHSSFTTLLHDAALITIGENCILAEGVEISCHKFTGDRLFVAPVNIGSGTFVGRETLIGPRVRLGKDCWIDSGQDLMRVQLADGSKYPQVKNEVAKDETCAS